MIVSENWPDLLEPGLRKAYDDTLRERPSNIPMLYNVQSSSKAIEHDLSETSLLDFEEMDGKIPYDDMAEGYKTNYVHQEFARGMKVERKLVDDDLYNVIARKPQQLGLAAFRKRETDAASVFVNAFVSNITGGDGVSLGNAAHPSNNGGPSQSNTGTTAISPTAVDAARISMVKYVSNRGNPLTIQPDMLIVPVDLESYAYEIINTRGKVDTAQNNVNFHVGRYKLVVWPNYLVSATHWYLVDSKIMKMYLNWFDRIPPQFYKDTDFDTLVAKFAGYMRYSYGWSDWRWIYAVNS